MYQQQGDRDRGEESERGPDRKLTGRLSETAFDGNDACPHRCRSSTRLEWQVTCSDLVGAFSMKLSVIALDF